MHPSHAAAATTGHRRSCCLPCSPHSEVVPASPDPGHCAPWVFPLWVRFADEERERSRCCLCLLWAGRASLSASEAPVAGVSGRSGRCCRPRVGVEVRLRGPRKPPWCLFGRSRPRKDGGQDMLVKLAPQTSRAGTKVSDAAGLRRAMSGAMSHAAADSRDGSPSSP